MFLAAAMNFEIELGFRYFIFNSLEYFLPFTASAFVCCHLNLPAFLTPVSKLKQKKVEYFLCVHICGGKITQKGSNMFIQ